MAKQSEQEVEIVIEEELAGADPGSTIITDEEELKTVVEDLCKKYRHERAGRAEKERTWAKWRRQYEARPSQRKKNYPYPNASNVSPPLSQMIIQSLYSYLKGMYDAVSPPWYCEPLREGDKGLIEEAAVITKYYNMCSKSRLDWNLSKFNRDFLQEVAVMGTCYVKVPWSTQPWHFKSEEDGVIREVNATLHDGPALTIVPVEDYVYPQNWTDIQRMPWCAHDVPRPEHEMLDLAARGIYDGDAVDTVVNYEQPSTTVRNSNEDRLKESQIDRKGEYILTEFYFYYDADGDGIHEDIVFTVHVPTGTVLRQDYNRFGYRMVAAGNFISRTYSLEGRGGGQTTEHQQDEIEAIHNVRNDNMKFSNMRMLAVRRGAFRENESIYPGKFLLCDNPKEDIVPVQLGEVYPSSLQAENQTLSYAREASGISSTMSGFSDPTLGSRDTFRGQQMRTQRGTGLFTTIAEGLNDLYSEVGMMLFFQLVHHRDRVIARERKMGRLTEREIDVLEKALSISPADIPQKMAFHIRTSDVDETFEVKRQNMLSLTQLFSQYAQQVTPLAMMIFGPQGQQMQQTAPEAYQYMLSIYTGSSRLMSEVFKFFGEEDPTRYVPDTRKQEFLLDMMQRMTGQMINALESGQAMGGDGMMPMNGTGPAPGQGIGAGGSPQGGGMSGVPGGPIEQLEEGGQM